MISDEIVKVKNDIFYSCESGKPIILTNTAKGLKPLKYNALPIRFKPFDTFIKERILWADQCSVIAYIANKSVENSSMTVNNLKDYSHIKIDGREYELKYVEPYLDFGNEFLYVVIGGLE